MKILFLLKKGGTYGSDNPGYTDSKYSGLTNATNILVKELQKHYWFNVNIEVCIDANDIDKYVTQYQPDYCILEAIWVTPEKLKELVNLHKKFGTSYITRIHSNIPFLANEGNAIKWLSEYVKFSNVSSNNKDTHNNLSNINIPNIYLPNVFQEVKWVPQFKERLKTWFKESNYNSVVNIGCFGSIRPLKNQLQQAVAAIVFAKKNKVGLNFHINGARVEQTGEPNIKNIRNLFDIHPEYTLIEHGWLNNDDFNFLISSMDVSMQVSFTESFNIVTAEAIFNEVPVVVSDEIDWTDKQSWADTTDINSIVETLESVLTYSKRNIYSNFVTLDNYNRRSLHAWKKLF